MLRGRLFSSSGRSQRFRFGILSFRPFFATYQRYHQGGRFIQQSLSFLVDGIYLFSAWSCQPVEIFHKISLYAWIKIFWTGELNIFLHVCWRKNPIISFLLYINNTQTTVTVNFSLRYIRFFTAVSSSFVGPTSGVLQGKHYMVGHHRVVQHKLIRILKD